MIKHSPVDLKNEQ